MSAREMINIENGLSSLDKPEFHGLRIHTRLDGEEVGFIIIVDGGIKTAVHDPDVRTIEDMEAMLTKANFRYFCACLITLDEEEREAYRKDEPEYDRDQIISVCAQSPGHMLLQLLGESDAEAVEMSHGFQLLPTNGKS